MNNTGDTSKEREARAAAIVAMRTFHALQSIRVNFVRHRGGFGINFTASVAGYSFSADELKATGKS